MSIQKFCLVGVVLIMTGIVNAALPAIDIQFLTGAKTMANVLQIQAQMLMSDKPKDLSLFPTVMCSEINIDEFLNQPGNYKSIYGCVFSDQVAMNAALLRAGIFVHTPLGLLDDDKLYATKLMTTVGGHDFDGKDFAKYIEQIKPVASTDPNAVKLRAIEQEFQTKVINKILDLHQDNFIFFAIINTKRFKENFSHELLHAQYYNVPEIAAVLDDVWNKKVVKKDQDTILITLQNAGYDMQQHDLLLREFYSYFLQYNPTEYLSSIKVLEAMAPLADTYAPLITTALAAKKLKVLTLPVE